MDFTNRNTIGVSFRHDFFNILDFYLNTELEIDDHTVIFLFHWVLISAMTLLCPKWNVDPTNCWNQGRPGSYLVNKLEIEVQCNLDLVTPYLVTTCDLVTILQRPFFNLLHKNLRFSDIMRFSDNFCGDQKCH